MNEHLSAQTLRQFAEGALADANAATVALHLDSCHHCLARVEQLDPFAEAFRAMPEPRIPDGLAQAAVLQAREATPIAGLDAAVGVGLLVAAALLVIVAGDPLPVGVQLGVLTKALWVGAGHVLGGTLLLSGGMLASTAVACGLAMAAVRFNRSGRLA